MKNPPHQSETPAGPQDKPGRPFVKPELKRRRINATLAPMMIAAAKKAAFDQGLSLSEYIEKLVQKQLSESDPDSIFSKDQAAGA